MYAYHAVETGHWNVLAGLLLYWESQLTEPQAV